MPNLLYETIKSRNRPDVYRKEVHDGRFRLCYYYMPVVAKTNNQTILWLTCEHAIHHGNMLT